MLEIVALVSDVNTYLKNAENPIPNVCVVKKAAVYITHILRTFGVVEQVSKTCG